MQEEEMRMEGRSDRAGPGGAGSPPVREWSVSVVIPSYNIRDYIGRTLRSVLDQTVRPLEILVVDDGSTDGTGDVAGGYPAPVRVIRQTNAGPSGARNTGILAARGEFVALLDGDDEWRPRHLENAMRVFGTCPHLQWHSCGYKRRTERRTIYTRVIPREYLGGKPFVEDFFPPQARWTFCCSDTVVARRGLFDEVGLFDTAIPFAEDMDLWFRIALRHPNVGYCPEVTAVWWAREGSLSAMNPKTPHVLLDLAERYAELAGRLGPGALARCRPLVAKWLATAVKVACKNGEHDVLRTIANDYGQWVSPELRWFCRLFPKPLLRSVASAKKRLKALRLRM